MTDKPNPPGDFVIEQFEAMKPLAKLIGILNPELRKQFQDIELQVNNIKTMTENRDKFSKFYAPLGWVNYDRMSVDTVAKVLSMDIDEGESILTNYHLDLDNLNFLRYRFHTPHYKVWGELYERAVERAVAGDYLSAVPLILILIDGICTTTTGNHPFSGGADAPVFDSQTSGPGGLSEGLALFGSTRRKLDSNPIPLPYRHGIVHGINPSFGHPIVAAKAFNLLQAMVDYFDRRRDEDQRLAKAAHEQRSIDLKELGRDILKNAETNKQLNVWKARPVITDAAITSAGFVGELEEGSPENMAVIYLEKLMKRNFGELAALTLDYPKRAIGNRAGRLRNDLQDVIISDWVITGVEDTAAAMTNIMVIISGTLQGESWKCSQKIRLMYADDDNNALIRGQEGGKWIAIPDFINNLRIAATMACRK